MPKSSLVLSSGVGLLAAALGVLGCAYGSTIDPDDEGGSSGDALDPTTGTTGAGATTGSPSATSGPGAGTGGQASSSTGDAVGGGAAGGSSGPGGMGGSIAAGGAGGGGSGLDGTAQTLLAIFAGSANSSVIASAQDFVNNTGFSTPFIEQTSDRVGLAVTGTGVGVLVVRAARAGDLRYSQYNGSWVPGFAMPLASVQPGLLLEGGPAIAGTDVNSAHVAYRRSDSKLYYAAITSGFWSPTEEPVGGGASQSSSPVPPAIATVGAGDAMAIFVGADGDLWDRTRSGGVWQAASAHGLAGTVAAISPSVVSLASGPELLVVFSEAATNALKFTTLTAGSWSAPAAIPNATCNEVVSLTALPSLGAAVAWRAPDGALKARVYDPSDVVPWSEPSGIPAATIVGPPAIASGALGARAELIWVDTTYIVQQSRLVSGTWTAPLLGGASGERIALAAGL